MVELVWSEHCGQCGISQNSIVHKTKEHCWNKACNSNVSHLYGWHLMFNGKQLEHHVFVCVPLNFDEWRKELGEKLNVRHPSVHSKQECAVCEVTRELLSGLNSEKEEKT